MTPALATSLRVAGSLAVVAGLGAVGWIGWDMLAGQSLANVRYTSTPSRVDPADLERLAAGLRGRPAREVPLSEVRAALRSIAWVREATVRWQFPADLEITIEEHEPLARWDDERLVSVRGEVFAAIVGQYPGLGGQLIDDSGSLHKFVNVYVNGEDIRFSGSLDTAVRDGDTVTILPAVAGGCR